MKVVFSFKRGQLIIPPSRVEHEYISHFPQIALDTGARSTLITPKLADEIGIKLSVGYDGRPVRISGIGGTVSAKRVTIKRISIGSIAVENIHAVCSPLSHSLNLDGVLGLDFLQYFNLVIDNDNERITISKRPGLNHSH